MKPFLHQKKKLLVIAAGLLAATQTQAQSEIYPQHFDLEKVTLWMVRSKLQWRRTSNCF